MLGQYMNSIGYGAYEAEYAGLGGFGDFGELPSVVANFVFTPEPITEGKFKGAKLSRGFQIVSRDGKDFIVLKGATDLSALASGNVILQAAIAAAASILGQASGVEIEITDPSAKISQQTELGGPLVFEPAGMNMILIAAVVGVLLVAGLYFMKKKA